MRPRVIRLIVAVVLAAGFAAAQDKAPRAWQQRLELTVPLAVPVVEVPAVNPFASPLDTAPELLQATPPRKLDVAGTALVAAYVDERGQCHGAVPVSVPFTGLTTGLLADVTDTRFEPARVGKDPRPTWAELEIRLESRVKEAAVVSQVLELSHPGAPPRPADPARMAPPARLVNLPWTPAAELSTLVDASRLRVRQPGHEGETPLRALVHVTADGAVDRFVPLEMDNGLEGWFATFLGSWRLQPATAGGQPVECWILYSAVLRVEMSPVKSASVRVRRDVVFDPTAG